MSIRSASTLAVLAAAAAVTVGSQAMAAAVYWDADFTSGNATSGTGLGSITQGARGTSNANNIWNTSNANWWDGVAASDAAVANFATAGTTAVFNGTAGTVNLSANIIADTMQIDSAGYAFQMDNSNHLATGNGTAYNISINALTGSQTATFATNAGAKLTIDTSAGDQSIKANIGGTGGNQVSLVKTGGNTLTWSGILASVRQASATDTTVQVQGGTLKLGSGWSGGGNDSGISLANPSSTFDFNGISATFGRGVSGTANTIVTNSSATTSTLTENKYSSTTDAQITGNLKLVYNPSNALTNVLTLTNNSNNYTGGTQIQFGTLAVGADGALGSGAITVGSSARVTTGIRSNTATARTLANSLSLGGGDRMAMVFGSAVTGDLTFTAASSIANVWEFQIDNANTSLTNTLSGTGMLRKIGTGNLVLSGTSSFSGGLTIEGGTVIANSLSAAGSNSAVGNASNTISGTSFPVLTISKGAMLQYAAINSAGGGAVSTDRLFAVGPNGGTIDSSGTGAINFTNTGLQTPERMGVNTATIGTTPGANQLGVANTTIHRLITGMVVTGAGLTTGTTITSIDTNSNRITLSSNPTSQATGQALSFGYGTRTLTLTGSNTDNNTIAGILQNSATGGGALGLSKTGAGTWVLSGTNTYTGATSITGGKLVVDGSIANSAVSVGSLGTLAGIGSTGAVTITGGTLAPGDSPGTITLASLSLNSSSTLNFELQQAGVAGGANNDLVTVTNGLTLGGTLNIADPAGGPTFGAGTYRLFNYGGTLAGSLAIGTTPVLANAVYSIDTATAGEVNLVVSVPEPAAIAIAGLGMGLVAMRRRRQA